MIPNHILTEIARRLANADPEQIATLAGAVGIDQSQAIDPLPSIEESAPHLFGASEEQIVHGAVPFEVKLTVLGHEVTQTCRAVYSTTLVDDKDRRTGEPIRVLGQLEIDWQIMDWRDPDRIDEETGEHLRLSVPRWADNFEGLLPTAVPGLILDLIEEQARTLEQSNS